MIDVEQQFEAIAHEYGMAESDPIASRYEMVVNWPSIYAMLPKPPAEVLDYGCGSGTYADKLIKAGYAVIGTDNSPTMVELTRQQGIHAQLWDYKSKPLVRRFDAIVAKLVVQFVEDLDRFADVMRSQLKTGGYLLISVPHPQRSERLTAGKGATYNVEIGSTAMTACMIHRTQDEIVGTVTNNKFLLESTDEPVDAENPDGEQKRLNLCFIAVE